MTSIKSLFTSKLVTTILAVIVSCVFFVNYQSVFDEKPDLNGDNFHYYALAQSLHNGTGYSNTMGATLSPHMHFPPGYSAFMSCLMYVCPRSMHAMKVANGVLFFLSILILFFLIYNATSNNILAACVCLLTSCHAELLRWSTIIMSEMLYLFIAMTIIYLFAHLDYKNLFTKSSWKSWVVLIIGLALIAYTYFVRTMGIALILAASIWALSFAALYIIKGIKDKTFDWHLISKYAIVGVLIIGSFLVAKTAWGIRNERAVPNFRSDYFGDFQKKPGGEKMTTFNDWVERATTNFQSYITYYIPDAVLDNIQATPTPSWTHWVGGLLLVALIIYGLIRLGAIGYFMLLFAGITFAVLMIWPEQYAGIRYFVAVVPILLLGLCYSVYDVIRLLGTHLFKKELEIVPLIGVCILLSVLIPRYTQAQTYYRQLAKVRRWQQVNDPAMTQYIGAAEWCKKNINKNAIVLCRKTEIFYYYSKGIHTTSFPQYASVEEVMNLLEKKQPDYILIDWWYGHAYRTLYPAIMEHPEKFAFIQQWGEYDPKRNLYPTLLFAYKKNNP